MQHARSASTSPSASLRRVSRARVPRAPLPLCASASPGGLRCALCSRRITTIHTLLPLHHIPPLLLLLLARGRRDALARTLCAKRGPPRAHPSEPYMCVLYCSQRGYRVNLEPRFFAVGACGSEPYGRLTSWQPPLLRDARTTHEWRMRHCPPVFLRSRVVTRRSIGDRP